MDSKALLLCKQDLEHYPDQNLALLAKHRGVTASNKCDLCWVLCLDIMSNQQRAGMDPGDVSFLLSLPLEKLFDIALHIPLSDLTSLCQTHRELNDKLCNNDIYWQARYIQDFGKTYEHVEEVSNWKAEYRATERVRPQLSADIIKIVRVGWRPLYHLGFLIIKDTGFVVTLDPEYVTGVVTLSPRDITVRGTIVRPASKKLKKKAPRYFDIRPLSFRDKRILRAHNINFIK